MLKHPYVALQSRRIQISFQHFGRADVSVLAWTTNCDFTLHLLKLCVIITTLAHRQPGNVKKRPFSRV